MQQRRFSSAGMQGATPCIPFFVFKGARSHHHIEHVDEFLGLRTAAQAKDTSSQQPVTQENVAALDPVDPRDVLKIDNLGVLAAERALLEHLNTVGVDLNVFKPTRTFVLEQQSVVIHACHSRGIR